MDVRRIILHLASPIIGSANNIEGSISQNLSHPKLCNMATSIKPLLINEGKSIDQLCTLKSTVTKQIHALDFNHNKEMKQKACKRQQKLLSTQPKRAHAEMFGIRNSQRAGLQALKDPSTGVGETEPAKLARIITEFIATMLSAVSPKKGKKLPTEVPRHYPWDQEGSLDKFKLETPVTKAENQGQKRRTWLRDSILDKCGFQECLSSKNVKSPGSDSIYSKWGPQNASF